MSPKGTKRVQKVSQNGAQYVPRMIILYALSIPSLLTFYIDITFILHLHLNYIKVLYITFTFKFTNTFTLHDLIFTSSFGSAARP